MGQFHESFPTRRTQSFQRRFNRVFTAVLCLIGIIVIHSFNHGSKGSGLQTPVLGLGSSDSHIYFPAVGRHFFPRVPTHNEPPQVRPRTALFIPFTRNNTMLQQVVLSYIAAGWPRSDIVIIDNSGTMDSNNNGRLSPDNPFFLDYRLFRQRYGVSILQTPTLLSFAQLQNFMLRQALSRNWAYYFWSHMDIAIMSDESARPYKSFYQRVLEVLDSSALGTEQSVLPNAVPTPGTEELRETGLMRRSTKVMDADLNAERTKQLPKSKGWAVKFFDFDNLVLVNVEAWHVIGAWDTFIPYYGSDCDFYARLKMHGFTRDEVSAGDIFDIADAVADPEQRFFPRAATRASGEYGSGSSVDDGGLEPSHGALNSRRYQELRADLGELAERKQTNRQGRNTWQLDVSGAARRAAPEPWSYDARGFQHAWWATSDFGRSLYVQKWGTMECDLVKDGRTLEDMWQRDYLEVDSKEWRKRLAQEEHYSDILAETPIR